MGPTRVFRARHVAPDSIRGSFGLTDTRNTTHGSGESASHVHSHNNGRMVWGWWAGRTVELRVRFFR